MGLGGGGFGMQRHASQQQLGIGPLLAHLGQGGLQRILQDRLTRKAKGRA